MGNLFIFVDVTNPTWLVYVALLVVAVYFRFTRIFTIRNLDLALLLLISTVTVVTGEYRDRPFEASKLTEVPVPPEAEITASEPRTLESTEARSAVDGKEHQAELAGLVDQDSEPVLPGPGDEKLVHPVYKWGSMILMGLTLLLLLRLVMDESLTRRPRLEQNLNQAGLTFLCIPSFAILMVSVFLLDPPGSTFKAMEHGRALLSRQDVAVDPEAGIGEQPAPTETLIAAGSTAVVKLSGSLPAEASADPRATETFETMLARTLVVIAHTVVVLGLLTIGKQHFASLQLGIAMSCLYLLLPCTAVKVHQLSHVLPAACLIWAIASYRNPIVAGVLLGLASGTLFFAAFLLPLWAVFYGRHGSLRFMASVFGITAILVTSMLMISGDASSFTNKLVTTANWTVYRLLDDSAAASDDSLSQLFIRIPMAAVFFVMLMAMTVLPRPRNLENLLANSTSLVVAAQMWYPDDIGTYVLWYLPLFLLVIFRPRLDRFTPPKMPDRHAATVAPPTTNGAPTIAAVSRLSFFYRERPFPKR